MCEIKQEKMVPIILSTNVPISKHLSETLDVLQNTEQQIQKNVLLKIYVRKFLHYRL